MSVVVIFSVVCTDSELEVGDDADVIAEVDGGAVGGAAKLPTVIEPRHRRLESSAHRFG